MNAVIDDDGIPTKDYVERLYASFVAHEEESLMSEQQQETPSSLRWPPQRTIKPQRRISTNMQALHQRFSASSTTTTTTTTTK